MFCIMVGMVKKLPTESKLSKKKLNFEATKKTFSASKKYIKEQINAKRKHISLKAFLLAKSTAMKTVLANVVKKVHHPSKIDKKVVKINPKLAKKQRNNVIIGICQLFVVVSIAYSSYITYTFVENGVTIIILVPQVAFALFTLVKAFSKLYK